MGVDFGTTDIGNTPIPITDNAGSITVDGTVAVSNFPATQPVSGSVSVTGSVEITNDVGNPIPVNGTVTATGPVTDTQLRATPVPISGTVTANVGTGTQPISAVALPLPTGAATSALQTQPGVDIGDVTINNAAGASAVNVQDGGNSLTVDGTFFQATQPVSAAALPLPTGAATSANQTTELASLASIDAKLSNNAQKSQLIDSGGSAATISFVNGRTALDTRRSDVSLLAVTATGISGAAVTLTLPAAASVFHYIQSIKITKYAVAALTGIATPIVVTTTNLPGTIAFTFPTAQAIGTIAIEDYSNIEALRSSVVNTATTIVCPAIANVIWRVNVFYYTTG